MKGSSSQEFAFKLTKPDELTDSKKLCLLGMRSQVSEVRHNYEQHHTADWLQSQGSATHLASYVC